MSNIEIRAVITVRAEVDTTRPMIIVEGRIEPTLSASVTFDLDKHEEAVDLVCDAVAADLRQRLDEIRFKRSIREVTSEQIGKKPWKP
jgi:hypothetical protein